MARTSLSPYSIFLTSRWSRACLTQVTRLLWWSSVQMLVCSKTTTWALTIKAQIHTYPFSSWVSTSTQNIRAVRVVPSHSLSMCSLRTPSSPSTSAPSITWLTSYLNWADSSTRSTCLALHLQFRSATTSFYRPLSEPSTTSRLDTLRS